MLAGSTLEKVIGDGPDALNDYISSGEIEELHDVVSVSMESDEESENKNSKIDHNAQVIYGSNENNQQQSIPSLLALNVTLDSAKQPPSLLNLNVPPPYEEIAGGSGNWQRQDYSNRNKDTQKRRNRDNEGNRISRFDRDGPRPSRFDNNDNTRTRRNATNRNRRI